MRLTLSSDLHRLEDDHGYDIDEIFVGIYLGLGGTVPAAGLAGVADSRAERQVDPGRERILRFEVRVESGASGEIKARTISDDTGSTLFGLAVGSDDDGWTF